MAMHANAASKLAQRSSRNGLVQHAVPARRDVRAYILKKAFGGSKNRENEIEAQIQLMQERLKERRNGNSATQAMMDKTRRLQEKEQANLERKKAYMAAEKAAAEFKRAQEEAIRERRNLFGPGGKGVAPAFR